MKNPMIASRDKTGLLMDRFNRYLLLNKKNTFQIKSVWGKQNKRGNWSGASESYDLFFTPQVVKNPDFGKNDCLFSLQIKNIKDILNVHYGGDTESFWRAYSYGVDLTQLSYDTIIVREGDKIFFKHDRIVIVLKRPDIIKKYLSHVLMAI